MPFNAGRRSRRAIQVRWSKYILLQKPIKERRPSLMSARTCCLKQMCVQWKSRHVTYCNAVYWGGEIYEIRRGIWFEMKSATQLGGPLDENLAKQVEDGYRKFKLGYGRSSTNIQNAKQSSSIDLPKESPRNSVTALGSTLLSNEATISSEQRWALFGKHMNQSVVYTTDCEGWLQSDHLIGKLSRLLSSGTHLVRGYQNVEKLIGNSTRKKSNPNNAHSPVRDATPLPESGNSKQDGGISAVSGPEKEDDQHRKIDHLILVIHGIGQRLGLSIEVGPRPNFTNDIAVLRRQLKIAAAHLKQTLAKDDADKIPLKGGVQVLPIQWRHKVGFAVSAEDKGDDETKLSLNDISLEGIPAIRTIVSDVLLDG